MSSIARNLIACAAATALYAGSARAQLLPPLPLPSVNLPIGNVPVAGPLLQDLLGTGEVRQAVNPTLDTVRGLPSSVAESGAATLLELRRLRHRQMIREFPRELEAAADGQPVRRGVLVALNPAPSDLAAAARIRFRTISAEPNPFLGITVVHLAVPRGLSAREALQQLRLAAPGMEVDYDHVFEPAGGALLPAAAALASGVAGAGVRIGMIDGGVASHPSLARARIEQHGISGSPQATGHGTAIASLLLGSDGRFQGPAVGASLLVADVFGGNRAAGSASTVIRALGWLMSKRARVINISLVGPSNALVARAVQQVRARGIPIVAAVGNDGPAAPPQYPASYPGVVAITGVDARGRALPEAGRATHLDFAAPGADMAAALPGAGYTRVRGTSFAAPLATARLAAVGSAERLVLEARPGKGRVGRGIVCAPCRVDPKSVRAK